MEIIRGGDAVNLFLIVFAHQKAPGGTGVARRRDRPSGTQCGGSSGARATRPLSRRHTEEEDLSKR